MSAFSQFIKFVEFVVSLRADATERVPPVVRDFDLLLVRYAFRRLMSRLVLGRLEKIRRFNVHGEKGMRDGG